MTCAEAAMDFAIALIQILLIEESKVISELHNLVDALAKVCSCLACVNKCTSCLHTPSCLLILIFSLLQSLGLLSHCSSWLRQSRILLSMCLLHLALMWGRMIRPDNQEIKRSVEMLVLLLQDQDGNREER